MELTIFLPRNTFVKASIGVIMFFIFNVGLSAQIANSPDNSQVSDSLLNLPALIDSLQNREDVKSHIEITEKGDTITNFVYEAFDFGKIYTANSAVNANAKKEPILKDGASASLETASQMIANVIVQDIDPGKSVGQIPFDEGVTPSGGKNITVPILTVPVASSAPQVSLSYNSQMGNSTAGFGWQVIGIPSISVSNKTIHYDGLAAPADISNPFNCVFSLDGTRTGSLERTYEYTLYGKPTGRTAGNIQNFTYNFDGGNGNLTNRTDNTRSKTESFGYDNLNRLTNAGGQAIVYAANGNITSISDVGTLSYGNTGKPYQVTMLTPTGTAVPLREQNVTYTSYQRPNSITENGITATFAYNAGGDRVKMRVMQGATALLTRYYLSKQYELDAETNTERLYLGGDVYSAPAVYVKENNEWDIYYICRDYLGSVTHVANANGSLKAEYSYDAWGRLRNPTTQVIYAEGSEPSLFLSRGYTGHEHLPWFGLINMNARLYDAALGRFLSPDPYVQMSDFMQNFNRYSYCLNNPLKYIDPSGEIFGTIFGFVSDLFNNIFIRTFKWEKWDWTQTKLGWEIDKGLFHTDPNKSTGGRIWEFVSRLTWQLPQTLIGDLFVSGANAFGQVNGVTHGYGMTVVDMGLNNSAVTIGFYTAGPKGYKADWRDHLFVHEYGHYIQSQQHGPVYLFTAGIPSLQSAILQTDNPSTPRHHDRWFEADASYKGMTYFDKHYGSRKDGYIAGSPDYFDKNSFITGNPSLYLNLRTGLQNRSVNPISGKFHWTDIPIYIPVIGLFPYLFY